MTNPVRPIALVDCLISYPHISPAGGALSRACSVTLRANACSSESPSSFCHGHGPVVASKLTGSFAETLRLFLEDSWTKFGFLSAPS
jgi:hypothetical protein